MLDVYTAPPLVTLDDLEDFPGSRSEMDVAVAGALVRGACGWHIGPSVDVELTVDSDGGSLVLLPSLHLTEVSEVKATATGEVLTGWEWSGAGMLRREPSGGWLGFPRGFRALTIKAKSGIPVPVDLKAVVADLSTSAAVRATLPQGLKAKTVGEVTYTYLTSADLKDAVDPLEAYRHVLWRYELR